MPLTDLTGGFRDDRQRHRVAEIVQYRLADDRIRQECHSLMRFWWQLTTELPQIDEPEPATTGGRDKLAAVRALIAALRTAPDAVDAWIEVVSREFPRIEDRGWEAGVAWRRSLTFDEPEPAAAYRIAAETGDPWASYALGHPPSCYALGHNAHRRGDRDEAVSWWTKAGDYPPAVAARASVSGT